MLSPLPRLIALFAAAATLWTAVLYGGVPETVPEAAADGFQLLYELNLPVNAAWSGTTPTPYVADQSAAAPAFDRVGYFFELTLSGGAKKWVWASHGALPGDTAASLAVPHDVSRPFVRQRFVPDLSVLSNVPGILNGKHMKGGNVEIWSGGATVANNQGVYGADQYTGKFDWGDTVDATRLYGSFQVHNHLALQTLISWNGWATADGAADDFAIGNGAYPVYDSTGLKNGADFTERKLSVWVRPRRFEVGFSVEPQYRQIVPRSLATNSATVEIQGTEKLGGWTAAVLKVQRNGSPHGTEQMVELSYAATGAAFSFSPVIPAECASYDFQIWLRKPGEPDRLVKQFSDIAAGDAFLVYGQSNAVTYPRDSKGAAAAGYQTPWVRTFGLYTPDPFRVARSLYWSTAFGDEQNFITGAIGQWPEVLAASLTASTGIPIALINGALGGQPIHTLLRDDAEPDNLSDVGRPRPYNRMRYYAEAAGIREKVRAIFYYQGEGDATGVAHAAGFAQLRDDFHGDYPALEKIYITQIRPGCGEGPPAVSVRDVQRHLEDIYPDVYSMTASAMALSYDGCHLSFYGGNLDLGRHYFDIARRDLYGQTVPPDVDPPNPASARFALPYADVILLPWKRPVAGITVEPDSLGGFYLRGSTARVVAAVNTPDGLLLTLDRPAPEATGVTYAGSLGSYGWVRNSRGIGLMAFFEELHEAFPAASVQAPVADGVFPTDRPLTLRVHADPALPAPGPPIARLEIWMDGVLFASVENQPTLEVVWAVPLVGLHHLEVRAIDSTGHGDRKSRTFSVYQPHGPFFLNAGIETWLSGWLGRQVNSQGVLTQWSDSTGRQHHAANPGSGGPIFLPRGLGVMPALSFSPADSLTEASPWPDGDWTFMTLLQPEASGPARFLREGTGSPGWTAGLDAGNRLYVSSGGAALVVSADPLALGAPHFITVDFQASTGALRLWVDGAPVVTASVATVHPPAGWTLGGGLAGKIGEVILYARRLDEAERTGIQAASLAQMAASSTTFADWARESIPAGQGAGPADDPDADGDSNLVEYAFGTPPLIATEAGTGWLATWEGQDLLLRYFRPLTRPDVAVTPQESATLSQWTPVAPALEPGSTAGFQNWSVRRPPSGERLFLRLLISTPLGP